MNAKESEGGELQFELKYCERCGGLWLRPAGGGQIYCVGCGRKIADLPPIWREVGSAKVPGEPRWGDEGDVAGYEEDEGVDLGPVGGAV